jgi:transposase
MHQHSLRQGLMTLDRAGWHRSKALCIAENLTLLLPVYSPELNPVELLWWKMHDKYLSNQVFKTVDQLDKDVANAWCTVTCQPETIRSLCFFPWIESAFNN